MITREEKHNRLILIWLDGGPGHMDMYDMRPDAPEEYRGIWRPIPCKGALASTSLELFPKQAEVTDKFSMVRSLYHNTGGDHLRRRSPDAHDKRHGRWRAKHAAEVPGHRRVANRELGTSVKERTRVHHNTPHAASIGLSPELLC